MTRHLLPRHAFSLQRYSSSVPRHPTSWEPTNDVITMRQRRDDFWIPPLSSKRSNEIVDTTELLTRAGYLRQAYAGIYHMLPLGLRVQNKLENLVDKHMKSIRASKVSLSSISSRALWRRSGRLDTGSEFFKFIDRRERKFLLAPTHEEEITDLLTSYRLSPGQLPIRLYQVSRKYRDEKRPRGGLLRGREFIMKDLYTFDATQTAAYATYDQVKQAYRNFLSELKIDYVEARADSGSMGGNLSHEYHFPSTEGEDDVIHCLSCDYARNEEWVPECAHQAMPVTGQEGINIADTVPELASETFVDTSKRKLVKAYAPVQIFNDIAVEFNTHAVKAALKPFMDLDTGVELAQEAFSGAIIKSAPGRSSIYYLFDSAVPLPQINAILQQDQNWRAENGLSAFLIRAGIENNTADGVTAIDYPLLKQVSGNTCPQCKTGILQVDKAIEIGHTFHLGTRYSSKLDLTIKLDPTPKDGTPVEMGCHGIGISRLIAAVAGSMSDSVGLNWPAAIAPFHAVIVVDGSDFPKLAVARRVYDFLTFTGGTSFDVLLDDRTTVSGAWKLKDADLIGYPIIIIVGRTWQETEQVEVQCRRLHIKEPVKLEQLRNRVTQLLNEM